MAGGATCIQFVCCMLSVGCCGLHDVAHATRAGGGRSCEPVVEVFARSLARGQIRPEWQEGLRMRHSPWTVGVTHTKPRVVAGVHALMRDRRARGAAEDKGPS